MSGNGRWVLWIAASLAAFGASARAREGWPLEEVAPGVYAAVQPAAGRFQDSNSLEVAAAELELGELSSRFTGGDDTAERAWEEFVPVAVERVWAELAGDLAGEESEEP